MNYAEQPVFVTGLPRSGTSMVAGCLSQCGCWTGKTIAGGRENPKGFYEHVFLREAINKPILKNLGFDPAGIYSLPKLDSLPEMPPLKSAVLEALKAEGYEDKSTWLFKEPKLTLIWPIWQMAFPKSKWLIVNRNIEAVVNSCCKTSFMAQHSTERQFWYDLMDKYSQRLAVLKESVETCYEISSEDLVNGDYRSLEKIVRKLGLDWSEEKIKQFVEPDYWHTKS